jgi:cbb3-type cytochrome oxidase subunit 1
MSLRRFRVDSEDRTRQEKGCMQGIKPERSPDLSLPLRYMVAALVAFVFFSTAVPFVAPDFLRSYDDPHVFSLVHLAVLGWITMIMMGALYQLFPVALQAEIRSVRLGKWNFWLFAGGVAGFVPSFYLWWTPGIAIFGTCAVAGVIHFASNMFRSYPSVKVWNAMAYYVLCALCWLTLTVLVGFVYALDEVFGWFDISPNILAAHAHLGLAGWFSLTLMGVSYKLMAMFSLAHGHDETLAKCNLVLWNLGLLGLVMSLVFVPGSALVAAFAVVLNLSATIFVIDMVLLFRRRRRKGISLEQWHAFISFASFLLAADMGVVLATGHLLTSTWVVAYGYVALVGWFGFSIMGKYYKIIPFLLWVHRYSKHIGSQPVPLLKDMLDERVGYASLIVLFLGYVTVLTGILASSLIAVRIGGGIFALGSYLFAYNIWTVFGDKASTRRQVADGRRPLPPHLMARLRNRVRPEAS